MYTPKSIAISRLNDTIKSLELIKVQCESLREHAKQVMAPRRQASMLVKSASSSFVGALEVKARPQQAGVGAKLEDRLETLIGELNSAIDELRDRNEELKEAPLPPNEKDQKSLLDGVIKICDSKQEILARATKLLEEQQQHSEHRAARRMVADTSSNKKGTLETVREEEPRTGHYHRPRGGSADSG